MRAAWSEFREVTDPLAIWFDRHTVETPNASVPKDILRVEYAKACESAGRPRLAENQFTSALRALRPQVSAAEERQGGGGSESACVPRDWFAQ